MFDSPGCRLLMPYGEFVRNWAHFTRRLEDHCVRIVRGNSIDKLVVLIAEFRRRSADAIRKEPRHGSA